MFMKCYIPSSSRVFKYWPYKRKTIKTSILYRDTGSFRFIFDFTVRTNWPKFFNQSFLLLIRFLNETKMHHYPITNGKNTLPGEVMQSVLKFKRLNFNSRKNLLKCVFRFAINLISKQLNSKLFPYFFYFPCREVDVVRHNVAVKCIHCGQL